MFIRNLDALFDPSSIALVGASNQPGSIGSVLAGNLYEAGSDVGGVRLDLASAEGVLQAAEEMRATVRQVACDAAIDGFNVQKMIRRRDAHELIVGVAEDSVFGPVILFGEGGTVFAARLTQIDYDREMAFVALEPGCAEILGAVRLSADPDREDAEYAIMVRSDMKGTGLGYALMKRILEYAGEAGIGRVFGDVLKDNHRMLRMARDFGFAISPAGEDADSVTVEISLTTPATRTASREGRRP